MLCSASALSTVETALATEDTLLRAALREHWYALVSWGLSNSRPVQPRSYLKIRVQHPFQHIGQVPSGQNRRLTAWMVSGKCCLDALKLCPHRAASPPAPSCKGSGGNMGQGKHPGLWAEKRKAQAEFVCSI